MPLRSIFLRGLLAVGSKKHRMFAVLLWALRVPSTSAAARFSSISSLVGVLSFLGVEHHQAVDPLRLRVPGARAVGECLDIGRPLIGNASLLLA